MIASAEDRPGPCHKPRISPFTRPASEASNETEVDVDSDDEVDDLGLGSKQGCSRNH